MRALTYYHELFYCDSSGLQYSVVFSHPTHVQVATTVRLIDLGSHSSYRNIFITMGSKATQFQHGHKEAVDTPTDRLPTDIPLGRYIKPVVNHLANLHRRDFSFASRRLGNYVTDELWLFYTHVLEPRLTLQYTSFNLSIYWMLTTDFRIFHHQEKQLMWSIRSPEAPVLDTTAVVFPLSNCRVLDEHNKVKRLISQTWSIQKV